MKDTYTVKGLQRSTAAAIRAAENGKVVTITRCNKPVAHVISAERLGGMLETMELLADGAFMRQLKLYRTGKLKFYPLSALAD